jgi:hypothetical protein
MLRFVQNDIQFVILRKEGSLYLVLSLKLRFFTTLRYVQNDMQCVILRNERSLFSEILHSAMLRSNDIQFVILRHEGSLIE